ncbi:MAG: cytochrome c-type biogenesis protein [Myxococcota bacterium]
MNRLFSSLAVSLVLLTGAAPAVSAPDGHDHQQATVSFDKYVAGATELEGRIIAPCCWTQTIDIHGSPVSTELRQEIRQRLTLGESAEAIERSLVERYGAKVLAVPPGSQLGSVGIGLGLVVLGAGIGAVALLKRWQRRSGDPSEAPKPQPAGLTDAELDARVDAELSRLDRE